MGQFDHQDRFDDGRRGSIPFFVQCIDFLALRFGAVIHLIHIPKCSAQSVQIFLIQIGDLGSILGPADVGGKDRQNILPRNGIAAIVGLDLLAVVVFAVFNFL